MEFKQAALIWKRMCNKAFSCNACLLKNRCIMNDDFDPDQAEAILTKWAADHPEKTIADDFFEKHPRAKKEKNGAPPACAREVGYIDKCPSTPERSVGCDKCWRRPLAEVEG